MSELLHEKYEQAHLRVMKAIQNLEERIHDMPAPGHEIDWEPVGKLNHIASLIEKVASC